jgi:3-phenylpropionate/cinnamic acid dioxygenase small subunit
MPTAVEEKEAIRELFAEYCFTLDDGRFDEMAAFFGENGTWDTAFGAATGRAAITDLALNIRAGAAETRPRGIHLVTNISITLDGDSARVRSNWTVVQNSPEGPKIGSGGAYHDELVKEGGQWRFRYRKIDRFIAP